LTRAFPLVAIAAGAFAAGVVFATGPARSERQLVTGYVTAWRDSNFTSMYNLLDAPSQARLSAARFRDEYAAAATTATLVSLTPGPVGQPRGNVIAVPVRVQTRIFGTLEETMDVVFSGSGSGARVTFSSALLFPGLRPRERLTRRVSLPPRASLYARDGTVLAQGASLYSPIPQAALQVVGTLGPIPAPEAPSYAAEGYPPNAQIGNDGLELVFQRQLAGTPGGTLFAGRRALAFSQPVPGASITTAIDPALEDAEIAAMANRYAGMVAMDPRNGQLLAVTGIAYSAPQPPGSTMKIITATAALAAKIVTLSTVFPIATSATLQGYTLQNANGEACGGTLLNAFAVSCNSVFAPLGAQLGGARLVSMAQKFGFNAPPILPGEQPSTIPPASTIGDSLAVGSSAIGQGMVLATPLEMAIAGATIAMGGKRPVPTFELGQTPRFIHVTSRHVASLVQKMMIAVIQFGTGTAAAVPGVTIAGKTGTAELTNTVDTSSSSSSSSSSGSSNTTAANNPKNTDAWFVGYGPVGKPRIVVAALFPAQGAGGATAAPAVQQVLAAALGG
jgi:cell division protein FtsI/penicillin-binding protein 2